jgi:hypothetical protein
VTAAMAQVLIDVGRPAEARGWCQEALAVARAVGSVDDEADALVTLGRIENYADPANARSLYAEGRTRAASVGNLEIEARALEELAWLDEELGNLAAAGTVFDEGAELAERTGLGWSQFGISGPASAGPSSGSGCAAGSVGSATRPVPGMQVSGWPRPFPSR